jgi:hypothetical protein
MLAGREELSEGVYEKVWTMGLDKALGSLRSERAAAGTKSMPEHAVRRVSQQCAWSLQGDRGSPRRRGVVGTTCLPS